MPPLPSDSYGPEKFISQAGLNDFVRWISKKMFIVLEIWFLQYNWKVFQGSELNKPVVFK